MSTIGCYGQPLVGTVNPLSHWLWVPFCTRSQIPLRGLSGLQGIGFRIPLRGLSRFWAPLGFLFLAHPLPVPVHRYFKFHMNFFVALI